MKQMNIKELEITKEMYNRAKEVENLFEITKKLDCRSEKFKKLNNKWIELDEKFEREVSDEFGTLEIVNEYERRERNAKTSLKTVDEKKIEDEKMTKQEKRFIKFIGKKICEVLESYNYRYSDELYVYEEEELKKQRYDDVERLIQRAEDRGVNSEVIEYLNSMNEVLYSDKGYIF